MLQLICFELQTLHMIYVFRNISMHFTMFVDFDPPSLVYAILGLNQRLSHLEIIRQFGCPEMKILKQYLCYQFIHGELVLVNTRLIFILFSIAMQIHNLLSNRSIYDMPGNEIDPSFTCTTWSTE